MNKKFVHTAAVTMGLTFLSLPLVACNVNPDTTTPQRTGIINRQNRNMPNSNTEYQRINNTGLRNDLNRIASPVPGNRYNNNNNNLDGNIIGNTPLPGTNIGTTPAPNAGNMMDMRNKSQNIESQLESLAEVKDASVMVVGNTALVACDPQTNGTDVNALRNNVTQKVKSVDPSITNVVITESADVKTSMQQLFSNMNNKTMEQITQEFNKLIRELTPTLS